MRKVMLEVENAVWSYSELFNISKCVPFSQMCFVLRQFSSAYYFVQIEGLESLEKNLSHVSM